MNPVTVITLAPQGGMTDCTIERKIIKGPRVCGNIVSSRQDREAVPIKSQTMVI